MQVTLGKTKFAAKGTDAHRTIVWDPSQSVNGHMILCGGSGVGKTHQLRRIIASLADEAPLRFHIIDSHGDIRIPGESQVAFTEIGDYGLNPLKISDDLDFGGVRKRVRSFVNTLSRTTRAIGTKQEAALINLLTDLYAMFGFYVDKPGTWSVRHDPRPGGTTPSKRQPTLTDLKDFIHTKLQQMIIGGGSKAFSKLEDLNKKYRSLERAHRDTLGGKDDTELPALKNECVSLYSEYIESIETGRELDDLIKYYSREVMQSVYERIVNMDSVGIFKPAPPPFGPNDTVRRYDIKALNADEQQMFVEFLLEELFLTARRAGEHPTPRGYIVIDEAQKFMSDDPDHIINVLMRESRKFGIGLILASQSLEHFSPDVLSNTSAKLILGLDEIFHASTARRLGVDVKRFRFIQPKSTALVQVKGFHPASANHYTEIELSR